MQYRQFGRTGWQVSEIAFGAWQLGGDWGAVDELHQRPLLQQVLSGHTQGFRRGLYTTTQPTFGSFEDGGRTAAGGLRVGLYGPSGGKWGLGWKLSIRSSRTWRSREVPRSSCAAPGSKLGADKESILHAD